MLTEKQAVQVASDVGHKGINTEVAKQVTNGVERYVVHITHDVPTEGIRPRPYTLSEAP